MAAALPEAALAQTSVSVARPANRGNKRKLLLLSDFPDAFERLIQSVKSIKEWYCRRSVGSRASCFQLPARLLTPNPFKRTLDSLMSALFKHFLAHFINFQGNGVINTGIDGTLSSLSNTGNKVMLAVFLTSPSYVLCD
jgi:hypothetical protein